MKKAKAEKHTCGNCIWWDGGFCDNDADMEGDRETDEDDSCDDWRENYYARDD